VAVVVFVRRRTRRRINGRQCWKATRTRNNDTSPYSRRPYRSAAYPWWPDSVAIADVVAVTVVVAISGDGTVPITVVVAISLRGIVPIAVFTVDRFHRSSASRQEREESHAGDVSRER